MGRAATICETQPKVLATAQLAVGEEPGRVVEDGAGHVDVVLRHGRAIATLEIVTGELLGG